MENKYSINTKKIIIFFGKVMEIIVPIAIYLFVNTAVFTIGAMVLRYFAGLDGKIALNIKNNTRIYSAIISVIAIIAGILAISRVIKQERPFFTVQNKYCYKILISLLAGAGFAVLFNLLFNYIGQIGKDAVYNQVATEQFSLPLWTGLLLYGLFTPFTEELIFRGFVYNRTKKCFGPVAALISNPLIFGLYHGNLVQMVYGILMGVLICFVYEYFGSMIYPYILHLSANAIVYILTYYGIWDNSPAVVILMPAALIISLISLVGFLRLKKSFAN